MHGRCVLLAISRRRWQLQVVRGESLSSHETHGQLAPGLRRVGEGNLARARRPALRCSARQRGGVRSAGCGGEGRGSGVGADAERVLRGVILQQRVEHVRGQRGLPSPRPAAARGALARPRPLALLPVAVVSVHRDLVHAEQRRDDHAAAFGRSAGGGGSGAGRGGRRDARRGARGRR